MEDEDIMEEGRSPIPIFLPTTRRRSAIPNHPPYSEMVQVALRSLSEKEGSTLPAISSFILSNYSGLPWAHSRFLPYYLQKLLLAGDISMPYPSRFSINPTNPQNPNNPNPHNATDPPCRGPGGPRNHKNPTVAPPLPMPPRRGRGRPRKYSIPVPVPMPSSMRPRLILHLKRRKPADGDGGDGGDTGGGGWLCFLSPTVPDTGSVSRIRPNNHGRLWYEG